MANEPWKWLCSNIGPTLDDDEDDDDDDDNDESSFPVAFTREYIHDNIFRKIRSVFRTYESDCGKNASSGNVEESFNNS